MFTALLRLITMATKRLTSQQPILTNYGKKLVQFAIELNKLTLNIKKYFNIFSNFY